MNTESETMKQIKKQDTSSRDDLITEAFEEMDYHLQIARNKIIYAIKTITIEDLGELSIEFDSEENNVHIGFAYGNVEIEEELVIPLKDIAYKLLSNANTEKQALLLINGLEKITNKVKKLHSESKY
jgi:hypothetical protein